MRIGIITFYRSKDNYGQLLQCYALQRFLKKQSHSPYLILYCNTPKESTKSVGRWNKFVDYIVHFKTYVDLFFIQRKERFYNQTAQNEQRHFSDFINKYIDVSEQNYTDDLLQQNPPLADAYICGSDQIWGGDFAYYLNFAPPTTKRIAYAASFGGVNSFSIEYEDELRRLLGKFSMLGVREQSGVNTCLRLGAKHAMKVVDPTLLLEARDYDMLRTNVSPKEKYIFVYLLGNPIAMKMKEVYQFAKEKRMKVVYVASQGQYDKYPKTWATIGDWIDYIANAECVITNSFHCTVFALHYSVPFVSVPLVGNYERMNTRINELLEVCNLSHRIYNGSLKEVIQSSISFEDFKDYLKKESEQSSQLLLSSLEI